MTSNLAVITDIEVVPRTMAELQTLATHAAKTRFFGCETPEQALLIMMTGRDLGLSYTQSLRAFSVIKGRPSLTADGAVALCLAAPRCEYFRCVSADDTQATWETKRSGGEPVRSTFTIKDAERAGLNTEVWKKYPKRMLSARAKIFLARDVYPEILVGLYDPDELENFQERAKPVEYAPRELPANQVTDPIAYYKIKLTGARTADELRRVAKEIMNKHPEGADPVRVELNELYYARKEALAAEVTGGALHSQRSRAGARLPRLCCFATITTAIGTRGRERNRCSCRARNVRQNRRLADSCGYQHQPGSHRQPLRISRRNQSRTCPVVRPGTRFWQRASRFVWTRL